MSIWGHLEARYAEKRPRKILALDGGGIRGVVTLGVLDALERELKEKLGGGDDFRLCEFFDYIGGTSTGAIIAAGLARGMSSSELLSFYEDVGAQMFDKRILLMRWRSLYKSKPLAAQLQETFGENTTLEPEHLQCLMLAVTRNASTDSPWPISSNPQAKYNELSRADCNLKIPMWQIVRASTAAPVYFPPEVVEWDPNDPSKAFVFEDGGVTPYNNPAFLLYRMATVPEYKLGWDTGERNLLIVSVGTGLAPSLGPTAADPGTNVLGSVAGLPGALIGGAQVDQDTNCRVLGHCVHGDALDREIGDLIPRDGSGNVIGLDQDLGRAFGYARYNCELTREGLDQLGLQHIDPADVQKMDSVEFIPELKQVGQAIGSQVDANDFAPFLP